MLLEVRAIHTEHDNHNHNHNLRSHQLKDLWIDVNAEYSDSYSYRAQREWPCSLAVCWTNITLPIQYEYVIILEFKDKFNDTLRITRLDSSLDPVRGKSYIKKTFIMMKWPDWPDKFHTNTQRHIIKENIGDDDQWVQESRELAGH